MDKPGIIFLVGPTAAGKTRLAFKIARRINAEIISCDSMQVYKGMDVISSKPSVLQRRNIKHHLIDIISPQREYNAALYRSQALEAIKTILKKGKIPLFVGGTGLYAAAVIDGVFTGPGADKAIRRRLYRQAETRGTDYLYKRLLRVDRQAADKIHHHDLRRIVRALEVWIKTKKPISQWQRQRQSIGKDYRIKIFCLDLPRQELYRSINQRVKQMFKNGLVNEVSQLLKKRLSKTARLAIGIQEIKSYLEGKSSLVQARELISRYTRQYAKRQLTWFRKDKRIVWVDRKDAFKVISAAAGSKSDG